jgi:repressor LexA
MIEGIGKGITEVKMGLTEKQAHFLKVIKDFVASNGYSPSYEEMKQMNGMRSKSNVHAYVYSLKKRGYLDIIRHSKRSIVLL